MVLSWSPICIFCTSLHLAPTWFQERNCCIFKMICLTLKCVESQCICSVKLILVDACCAVRKYRNKGEAPSTTLMYFPTVFQRDYSLFNFLLILAVELSHPESFLMCLKSFWEVLKCSWTIFQNKKSQLKKMQDAPGKFLENPHQKLRLTLSSSPNYKLLTDERKTQRATHIREGSSRNDSYWFLRWILIFKNFWNSNCACSQVVPTASLVSEHILFSL